jgi:hypothetical protein
MKRRRVIMGLDKNVDEEEGLKRRVTRRGGEEEGFLGWKVCFLFYFTRRRLMDRINVLSR